LSKSTGQDAFYVQYTLRKNKSTIMFMMRLEWMK